MIAGALTLAITGAATYVCRSIPSLIVTKIKRTIIVSMSIEDNEMGSDLHIFERLRSELGKLSTKNGSRDFKVNCVYDTGKWETLLTLIPGYGNHYFMHNGRLFWYAISTLESSGIARQKSSLRISTFGLTDKALSEILLLGSSPKVESDKVTMWLSGGSSCISDCYGDFKVPTLDEVALDTMVKEQVRDILSDFASSKERCEALGIPHKLVILLHGEPGNGKSTLIPIIARELSRAIVLMNVSSFESDADFLRTLNQSNERVVAMEDIHSYAAAQEKAKAKGTDKGLTLAGLLNSLNGVIRLSDSVIILTTNYIDDLEPALLRPGRIDHIIELPRISPTAVNEYVEQISPGITTYARCTKHLRGCDVGQLMTVSKGDPAKFADAIDYIEAELPEKPASSYKGTNVLKTNED